MVLLLKLSNQILICLHRDVERVGGLSVPGKTCLLHILINDILWIAYTKSE